MARRKEHRTASLTLALTGSSVPGRRDLLVALAALAALCSTGRRRQGSSSLAAATGPRLEQSQAEVQRPCFFFPLLFGYFSVSHGELCEFRWRICHCGLRVGPRRLSSALSSAHFRKKIQATRWPEIASAAAPRQSGAALCCAVFFGAVPALACILGSLGLAGPIRSDAAKISSAPEGGLFSTRPADPRLSAAPSTLYPTAVKVPSKLCATGDVD